MGAIVRTLLLISAVLVLWVTAPGAGAADVVEGEILDMACYLPRGAKGPAHAKCAQSCAEKGMPLGLLTDDETVYLLYPKHGREAAFESVKELAGKRAKLNGAVSERSGMKGFEVHEATAAER
jgi:hypothetical protein